VGDKQAGELAEQAGAGAEMADGEPLLFRGETFTLRIFPGLFSAAPQLTFGELIVHVVDTGNQISINKKFLKWYKQEALRVFHECIEHFAPLMGVSPKEIKLTSARTQWGSCTAQGVVRLNWQWSHAAAPD